VNLLTEAFNLPSLKTVAIARPTISRTLYAQMIRRGARRAPGKDTFNILDFVAASERHMDQLWTGERMFPDPKLSSWSTSPSAAALAPEPNDDGMEVEPVTKGDNAVVRTPRRRKHVPELLLLTVVASAYAGVLIGQGGACPVGLGLAAFMLIVLPAAFVIYERSRPRRRRVSRTTSRTCGTRSMGCQ